MTNVGVVGLGDMGSGLAKNLIKNKFNTIGLDLSKKRMEDFKRMGGVVAQSLSDVGKFADIVFVMVMNGNQAKEVIINKDGLIHSLKKNSTVIITATIKPLEAKQIGDAMKDTEINIIDSPVSGGFPGAQNGTLTMMAAGEKNIGRYSSKYLAESIKKNGKKNIYYCQNEEELESFLINNLRKKDLVVFMGAGNISKMAHEFVSKYTGLNK